MPGLPTILTAGAERLDPPIDRQRNPHRITRNLPVAKSPDRGILREDEGSERGLLRLHEARCIVLLMLPGGPLRVMPKASPGDARAGMCFQEAPQGQPKARERFLRHLRHQFRIEEEGSVVRRIRMPAENNGKVSELRTRTSPEGNCVPGIRVRPSHPHGEGTPDPIPIMAVDAPSEQALVSPRPACDREDMFPAHGAQNR